MEAFNLKKEEAQGGAYYFVGDDGYLLKKAENFFRALLPEGALSLYIVDYLPDVNELSSYVGIYNFDGTPNIVLVRDEVKLNDAGHAALTAFLSRAIAPDCVVFTAGGNFTPAEKKLMTPVDCKKPDRFKCSALAEKLFPYGIETRALSLLCDYADCDLGKINNEAFKLVSYCESRKVTQEDVEALVAEDREIKFFAFSNSVVKKDKAAALKQLERLRLYGESDAGILTMLSGQFQRMLFASLSPLPDDELAALMGIKNAYAVTKMREIKGYGKSQLKNTFSMLLDCEHKFKSGVMNPSTALDLALSKLLD